MALTAEAEALLDPLICRTPGGVGGSQPGRHCAECCMGTGLNVTCAEEEAVALALDALIASSRRLAALSDRAADPDLVAARRAETLNDQADRAHQHADTYGTQEGL